MRLQYRDFILLYAKVKLPMPLNSFGKGYICSMQFLALFRESLLFALHAMRVNRLRTMLSLLGITIGIFAIIAVFTAVDAMEYKVRSSVESLGDNVVFVQKWPWVFTPETPWWDYLNRPVPKLDEAEEVARRASSAEAVVFAVNTRKTVSAGTSSVENVTINAVSKNYERVKTFDLLDGRFLTDQETEAGSPVVVLGYAVWMAVFHGQPAVGRDVKIFGRNMRVVGVFAGEGESMFGNSLDAQAVISVEFARRVIDIRTDELDPYMMAKAKAGANVEQLKDELTGIMRAIRRVKPSADDNFSLNEVSVLSGPLDQMFSIVGTAGWIIGCFAILVGGFGIANIMFVSVQERTNQIGIQKSLGAKNWFILVQFLMESVILCLIGGMIGLLLVYGGTKLLAWADPDFAMPLTVSNIILGLSISGLIGILSGFIPSYSAAQLDPVEAIRSNS
jgi:putative ABC transport system permease protein